MNVAASPAAALEASGRGRGPARPVVPAVIGACCISSSAIVVQLAHAPAGTTAVLRCALALPALVVLAMLEERRHGRRRPRERLGAALAGAFLGIDLVLWAHAIYDVGAGVATVLGNLQVLFVAVIAWLAFGERPQPRFVLALPVVLTGVVLAAGLLGHPRFGDHPVAGVLYGMGTSVTYAMFIVVLRRNTGRTAHVATPLAEATSGATVSSLALGSVLGQMNLDISLSSFGWLVVLSVVSQIVGWLFITSALPYLPAALSSLLLLFQPAAAMVLADVVLSQRPTLLQVLGALLVCGGVLWAARAQRGPGAGLEPRRRSHPDETTSAGFSIT